VIALPGQRRGFLHRPVCPELPQLRLLIGGQIITTVQLLNDKCKPCRIARLQKQPALLKLDSIRRHCALALIDQFGLAHRFSSQPFLPIRHINRCGALPVVRIFRELGPNIFGHFIELPQCFGVTTDGMQRLNPSEPRGRHFRMFVHELRVKLRGILSIAISRLKPCELQIKH